MLGATQAGLAFSNSLGRAGAWHVAPDRRAFPCPARPVQRHAAAGDHPLLGPGAEARYAEAARRIGFAAATDGDGAAGAPSWSPAWKR